MRKHLRLEGSALNKKPHIRKQFTVYAKIIVATQVESIYAFSVIHNLPEEPKTTKQLWLINLVARVGVKRACIALANKTVRIVARYREQYTHKNYLIKSALCVFLTTKTACYDAKLVKSMTAIW